MSTSTDSKSDKSGLTLTVLGCGTLGSAILLGVLDSLSTADSSNSEELPSRLPSKFIACVRSSKSVDRLSRLLGHHLKSVKSVQNGNVEACQEADVVLLGCKPYMVKDVLSAPGIREALAGKLLISICAGVPVSQIEGVLYDSTNVPDSEKCRVVRVMPNTPAGIRESMTVIANSEPPLPEDTAKLVTWIFTRVGEVVHLPASNMDVSTALCGSGPAFFALVLEAAVDGAVAMGLPRAEAQKMAAQTMKGAAGLVLAGEHPTILREKVSTPGGCTIGGLLVLEEGAVKGTVAKAIRETTCVASQLGKGVQGVNGTRF